MTGERKLALLRLFVVNLNLATETLYQNITRKSKNLAYVILE